MLNIVICIVLCLLFIIVSIILLSHLVKNEKQKRIWLIILSLSTFVCHYSSLLYHFLGHLIFPDKVTTVLSFVNSNPNLVLPIYPCNFVMWCLIIMAFIKESNSKVFKVFADFLFLFGIVSGLGGMLANGDYFNENVVKNYDIYKSCVAHAIMLINILAIPVFGYFKLDTLKNVLRTSIGILVMGVVGLWDALVLLVVNGESLMKSWNPMFLFNSPFGDSLPFVKFYIIMPLFVILLIIVLSACELFKYKKGHRWWNRIKKVN